MQEEKQRTVQHTHILFSHLLAKKQKHKNKNKNKKQKNKNKKNKTGVKKTQKNIRL